jgi:lipopolysaccharide transport system ATP-binding protein
MSKTIIRVENVSKQYKLGSIGTGTLSQDLNRWWAQVLGKEDPTRKIGEKGELFGEHWALRDVSFEIKQGEAVGIIGKNGAGKSTLLKILSRTTTPTIGHIKIKGRIASLLEVGTGFHPDLTGRENVFMNGAILGMQKAEIKAKFDEIVTFSGVEKYIDTPVKRYSSGMYVRLAFAVAAHLESEILILDEVLAVGDAEFQKKCLGKMNDVANKEGRTVLFVSHSMTSVQSLCNKAMFLKKGYTEGITSVKEAVDEYLGGTFKIQGYYKASANSSNYQSAQILEAKLLNASNQLTERFATFEDIYLQITWSNKLGVKVTPNIMLVNRQGVTVMVASDAPVDWDGSRKKEVGTYSSTVKIPGNLLNANDFNMHIALDCGSPRVCYDVQQDALQFSIYDPMDERCIARGGLTSVREDAILWPALEWNYEKVSSTLMPINS